MKYCGITINNKELTIEEFKEAVLAGDTSILGDGAITRKILTRYAITNKLDSIMEMQAKRIAERNGITLEQNPTTDDVNYWIYPRGHINDYVVQKAIHKNTYTGMRITGISANSGKTLGYLFEGTPITAIALGDVVYEGHEKIRQLLNSYRVDTVEELLYRHPNFKVVTRETVKLKDKAHVRIDSFTYDSFRRNEVGEDGQDLRIAHSGDVISIFETIDSIINLAIDNVKEQKLFTIGITNSNANAYFAAIALGIPIHKIVKIFTDPIMATLASERRIYPRTINTLAKEEIEKLGDFFATPDYDLLGQFLDASSIERYRKKLETSRAANVSGVMLDFFLANGNISTELLDKIFVGTKVDSKARNLSNLLLLETYKRFAGIGEEMFAHAQTLSLLRKLPTNMAKTEYLSELPRKYAALDYVATAKDLNLDEYISNAKEYIIANDKDYQALSTEKAKKQYLENFEKVLMSAKSQELISTEVTHVLESKFRNAMMYATLRHSTTPTSESVFENMSLLSIPHVYSSWKTLNFAKNVMERTFAYHHPVIKKFLSDLADKAQLFMTYNKYEMVEDMMGEFFRFISSGSTIDIDGNVIDLDTSKERLTIGNTVYSGVDAWVQGLYSRLQEAKANDDTGNIFLESVQLTSLGSGAGKIGIYADKLNDFRIQSKIKEGFRALYSNDATKQLALDLFKYSVLAEGLLYLRSSFSRVFPESFIAAYSTQFSAALNHFISPNRKLMLSRLDSVGDAFLKQFLRNYPDKVSYNRHNRPTPGKSIKKGEYTAGTYSGIATVGGKKFYYDLRFDGLDPNEALKIAKTFGNEVYLKIDVPIIEGNPVTFYRQITQKTPHTFYTFDLEKDLKRPFRLDMLTEPMMIIPSHFVKGSTLTDPNTHNVYKAGDTIYTYDIAAPASRVLNAYKITRKIGNAYQLAKSTEEDISLTSDNAENVFVKYPTLIGNTSTAVIYATGSKVKTLTRALNDPNGLALIRDTVKVSDKVLPFNISATEEEHAKTLLAIDSLSPSATYYIQDELLNGFDETRRKEYATKLYSAIGYVDNSIDRVLEEEDSITLSYKMRSLSKNRPHLRVGHGEEDHLTPNMVNEMISEGRIKVPFKNLPEFKKLEEGDMVYLGKKGNLSQFAYVEGIEEIDGKRTNFYLFLVPTTMSLDMLEDNYSLEEFEALLEKHKLNC